MSDEIAAAEMPSASLSSHAPTAGALMREARIAAGAHVESIAFSLKVSVAKIEALEEDNYSAFPDATFMRALASSVCRGLRIDPAQVLALMPHGPPHRLAASVADTKASFKSISRTGRPALRSGHSSRWLATVVILLVLGAAAVAWIPSDWNFSGRFAYPNHAPVAEVSGPKVVDPLANNAALSNDASRFEASLGAAVGSNEVSNPRTESSTGNAARPVTEAVQSDRAAGSDVSALLERIPRLAFTARAETWIQVTDGNRKVILERILRSGESVSVSQPGRLFVVVGRADVTEVKIAGSERDIVKGARDNVARFEVSE